MRQFLRHVVHTVFVMLGPDCNLRCRYCLQKPLQNGNKRIEGEEDITTFLRDLAVSQEERLTMHFYGGEPLLFRNPIAGLVEGLRGEPNIAFSMISNGTLMDAATADWCNDLGMHVAVSWDGPNTAAVRGVDVFADRISRNSLLKLNNLGMSAVVSAYNYPLETIDAYAEIDREYHTLHGYNTSFNFDELMDTGLEDRSLFAIDLDRVRRDMEIVARECEKALRGEEHDPWRANVGRGYVDRIRNTVRGVTTLERGTCACGNGISVLNLDMSGNLYRCHNTDTPIGTIRDGFARYMNHLMLLDPTRENSRLCKDCSVAAICNCGCPLIGTEARAESYCPLKKAMFQPVVDMVLRFGHEGVQK